VFRQDADARIGNLDDSVPLALMRRQGDRAIFGVLDGVIQQVDD